MNKKVTCLFVVVVFSLVVQAHEFWLQPNKFQFAVGETASIECMVGENFVGKKWDLAKNRIHALDHHTKDISISLLKEIQPGVKTFNTKLEKAGTHLFVLRSENVFIEMAGEEFNEYLKEDGLDDVLTQRKNTNTLDKPAKEFYARCTKVMVKAGDKTDETFKKKVGLPLEIVPVNDPYTTKSGEEISFMVLFEGKPLAFTLVKVWNRKDNNTILQNIYTQKDGIITTRLSNTGSWMVSSVKMVPSKDAAADWQSYWASFVFGI